MTTNYDPFRELTRMFNTSMRNPAGAAMPMDLYRSKDSFIARIDMPGVEPESIDIDVEDRTLTVRAERSLSVEGEDIEWLTRERSSGTYARQLTLGNGLSVDNITADYNDGVLTLTIPVAEEAKPRKVSVTRGSSQHQITSQAEETGE